MEKAPNAPITWLEDEVTNLILTNNTSPEGFMKPVQVTSACNSKLEDTYEIYEKNYMIVADTMHYMKIKLTADAIESYKMSFNLELAELVSGYIFIKQASVEKSKKELFLLVDDFDYIANESVINQRTTNLMDEESIKFLHKNFEVIAEETQNESILIDYFDLDLEKHISKLISEDQSRISYEKSETMSSIETSSIKKETLENIPKTEEANEVFSENSFEANKPKNAEIEIIENKKAEVETKTPANKKVEIIEFESSSSGIIEREIGSSKVGLERTNKENSSTLSMEEEPALTLNKEINATSSVHEISDKDFEKAKIKILIDNKKKTEKPKKETTTKEKEELNVKNIQKEQQTKEENLDTSFIGKMKRKISSFFSWKKDKKPKVIIKEKNIEADDVIKHEIQKKKLKKVCEDAKIVETEEFSAKNGCVRYKGDFMTYEEKTTKDYDCLSCEEAKKFDEKIIKKSEEVEKVKTFDESSILFESDE